MGGSSQQQRGAGECFLPINSHPGVFLLAQLGLGVAGIATHTGLISQVLFIGLCLKTGSRTGNGNFQGSCWRKPTNLCRPPSAALARTRPVEVSFDLPCGERADKGRIGGRRRTTKFIFKQRIAQPGQSGNFSKPQTHPHRCFLVSCSPRSHFIPDQAFAEVPATKSSLGLDFPSHGHQRKELEPDGSRRLLGVPSSPHSSYIGLRPVIALPAHP